MPVSEKRARKYVPYVPKKSQVNIYHLTFGAAVALWLKNGRSLSIMYCQVKNYKVTKNDCGLFTSLGSGPTAQGPYVLLAGCIISNVMINAVVPKPDAIARTAPRLTVNPNHL